MGLIQQSVAAAEAAFQPAFQAIDHQTFDFPLTAVAVLGLDLAHVTAQGTISQTSTDGVTTLPTPYAATLVIVRTGGGWKVRMIHQSTPNEPATS